MNKLILMIIFYSLPLSVCAAALTGYQTQEQNRIIASVIAAEACSEGPQAMLGVSNTIQNRANKKNLSPYEVITEPKQYAGLNNPNRELIYWGCKAEADRLATNIMELEDITSGALYFRTPDEPLRPWHKIATLQIGKLIFYK